MGYDGSLKFDTKIDASGFSSGIEKIGSIATKGLAVLIRLSTGKSKTLLGQLLRVGQYTQQAVVPQRIMWCNWNTLTKYDLL